VAGLSELDVIVSFNSTPIATAQDLLDATNITPPGSTVEMTYLNPGGGGDQIANVSLTTSPDDTPVLM
jgi:S1-C subfamily serine protease